jgi:hypothetical protein
VDIRFKEPAESLDFGIDWSDLLGTGETVTGTNWTTSPAGLVVGSQGIADNVSTVRLSGGTAGVEYEVEATAGTSAGNTLVESFILSVQDEPAVVVGERYCTVEQARNHGAQGSTRDVEAAIVAASARVDDFTGDRFTPRVLTVVVRLGGDGRAMLPHRLTDPALVTEVADADTDSLVFTAETFRAYTSAVQGEVDAIGVGPAHVGHNILVNGLEPYNTWRTATQRLRVTATFGHSEPPPTVRIATAMLAADLSGETPQGGTASGVDPEGNVIPVVPSAEAGDPQDLPDATAARTTGSRRVDAMLIPWRRHRTLVGV